MRDFIKYLYFQLKLDLINSCADDRALYVEIRQDGVTRYIKLTPSDVTRQEYDTAWDYAAKNEGE